jgi:diguanylate cyclase (GGDEF)-like protein/PAS domain S-box-containing protein
MYDSEGAVIGVLGVSRDVSDRKRKVEELSRVEALAKIGTWEWDASNNMFRGSAEAYRLFGFEPSDTISFSEVIQKISPEDREKVMMQFSSPSYEERHVGSIYKIIPREGELRSVRTHTDFVYDTQMQPLKAVGIVQDVTEQVEYENRLETLANYDPLTGLANRGSLQTHLQNAINQAKRHKTQIGLLMFDLDRFKDINDSYGHNAGDELLQVVSQRFSSRLRDGDIISRLGGDEFAVVLEHLSRPEDAGRLAEEMITALGAEYRLSSGALIHIGSSAGIVLFPDHGDDASELLQHADAALYKAKAEGRGIYHYYTDELTELARKRIEFETHLRRAILNQEFEVYYQPQVHIATGRIVGAEALIRWNCPVRGRVSPVDFIPIAEETGLIGEIGEWVLNEACRQGKIWIDKGYRLTLAVNLSAHQVRHQNIPMMVENALKKSGYPAARLELELTESALMQREEETVEMLHALRAHGIRLAIDDFGTGYSSLSYLKRFPIDVLKIDKSFVDDIPFEPDDMAIVTAIIAMAHALGFQVLAEGTERIEQIDFLREKGCTMYQGYYKSPPVPAEAFEALL